MPISQNQIQERADMIRRSQIEGNPVVRAMFDIIEREIAKINQVWHKKPIEELSRYAAQRRGFEDAKKAFYDACHVVAVKQVKLEEEQK